MVRGGKEAVGNSPANTAEVSCCRADVGNVRWKVGAPGTGGRGIQRQSGRIKKPAHGKDLGGGRWAGDKEKGIPALLFGGGGRGASAVDEISSGGRKKPAAGGVLPGSRGKAAATRELETEGEVAWRIIRERCAGLRVKIPSGPLHPGRPARTVEGAKQAARASARAGCGFSTATRRAIPKGRG